jgi:uncharacterized membrane protein YccC
MGMLASALSSFNKKSTLLQMLTSLAKTVGRIPASWGRHAWSIGSEDPRRAVHALKAGTALTLVSLLYILEPFFQGIGKNAMWAVMTVVVVLEFTAGKLTHIGRQKYIYIKLLVTLIYSSIVEC